VNVICNDKNMNVSINWLNKYVDLKGIDPKEIANKLTMSTVEVDAVYPLAENLENIFVAKIINVLPHPNADKLKLVDVDLGSERIRVVCGGSNLKPDMLVALARPGAMIKWHGVGEPVKLEETTIRGEESKGMICAGDEIGLGDLYPHKQGEILELESQTAKAGQALSEALELNDYILDIDNKSLTNRPDLWGHYGIARELAAIFGKELKEIKSEKIKEGKDFQLKVKTQAPELCPAYYAAAMGNIKVAESPKWLARALASVGQKSINNIVDITNYVMFDLGQPIHAFDASKISGQQIIVRQATPGEKLISLDNESRQLGENMLVIADKKNPIALAGIMGGKNSEISDKTVAIVIEAANFDPSNIRKTSLKLGLRTEASIRFEKGLDPVAAKVALERVVGLILENQPDAKVESGVESFEKYKLNLGPIELSKDFISKKMGIEIEDKKTVGILESLGFEVKEKKNSFEVKVPSFRATGDVSIPEDLIEEISRIYGYDSFTPIMPEVKNEYQPENKERKLERRVKEFLTLSSGLTEVRNYSFTKKDLLDIVGLDYSGYFQLENPWDENENLLRQNLWPQLLLNVKNNSRFFDCFGIFELGRVFLAKDGPFEVSPDNKAKLPAQPNYLAGAYFDKSDDAPFFKAKDVIEKLLASLSLEASFSLPAESKAFYHPFRSVIVSLAGQEIGWVAELNPLVASKLELDDRAAVWQLDFDKIVEIFEPKYEYHPILKFPSSVHDLSIVVAEKTMYKDIDQIIKSIAPQIIKDVELLDVFKNGKIKTGQKSVTVRIVYQADDRTLEKEEIDKLQRKVIVQLEKGIGAKLRT